MNMANAKEIVANDESEVEDVDEAVSTIIKIEEILNKLSLEEQHKNKV